MTQISNKGVPYIGVTDFTSNEQVTQTVNCLPEGINRRLHVGHMMSYKTFHGIPTQTGWENIWLRGGGLRALFQPHSRVFNVLHWADYGYPLCLTGSQDLIGACEEAGPYLQGLQLDMIWPRPGLVMSFKEKMPHIEVILQVGRKALEQLDQNSLQLRLEQILEDYVDFVDYFLIDWSMGRGEPMNIPIVSDCLRIASNLLPHDRLAVAGGLGPTSYSVLEELFGVYPHLSCDAQGQMRTSGKATDPLEMTRVCKYVSGVGSLLVTHSNR